MLTKTQQALFIAAIKSASNECFDNSLRHGFWPAGKERNKGEMIALMHSELSEMLEGVRKPGPDQHCPDFTSEEIEAADTLIRLLDYCDGCSLRLAEATIVKMAFNESRPMKHGKGF